MSDQSDQSDQTTVTEDDWGAALAEQAKGSGDADAQSGADADWAAALAEQAEGEAARGVDEPVGAPAQRHAMPPLEQADSRPGARGSDNLDVILDIPVTIAMEIGRAKIPIRNLLQLNQGSVVELDRLAGEPLDVLVNGTLIAHGEVVVVNERFGIRFTDVISPAERVQKLR